jgi:hypothetical protein
MGTITQWAGWSKKHIPRENAATEICGRGWNCSFIIEFTAPGYQCSNNVDLSGMSFLLFDLIPALPLICDAIFDRVESIRSVLYVLLRKPILPF